MDMINFDGLLIGIATFLIIGLFHPVVVKAEYYWGTKCWWIFLVLGIAGTVASLLVESVFVSAICGVFAFSSFFAIIILLALLLRYITLFRVRYC